MPERTSANAVSKERSDPVLMDKAAVRGGSGCEGFVTTRGRGGSSGEQYNQDKEMKGKNF